MGKKNKKPGNTIKDFIAGEIMKVLVRHPIRNFNHKQLGKLIKPAVLSFINTNMPEGTWVEDFKQELRQQITTILEEQYANGTLLRPEQGRYKLKPQRSFIEGIIDITTQGAAYLLNENGEDDIYIAPKNVKNALHGDRVKLYLYARHKHGRLEGEVAEIIKRARSQYVGKVQMAGRYAFVIPDNQKMLVDIFIPENKLNNALDGQKVIAEISDWPKSAKNPVGKIIQLLGWPGENDVEMNSILTEYGFPLQFPSRVEKEADAIPFQIDEKEARRRKDFRAVSTFTIDPHDAKDFDDALSVRVVDEKHWEIGVHIADVTHYVRPGQFMDREAYERATSVYLVDRVIAMLPEKLSNGVCSLRPREDKLCFSVVFVMNDKAEIKDHWIGKTIIHSNKRFDYDEAQQVIETGHGPFNEELLLLNDLAKKLRQERFHKGAIAFEKREVKFKLDEKGIPTGVYLKESKDSNKLIEEFMLLANRTVAERIGRFHLLNKTPEKPGRQPKEKKVSVTTRPFVYRVHDMPVAERLQSFARFASQWGYKLKVDKEKEISKSLNQLMKDISGRKEQNVLESLAIRSMSKAVYTTDNIGHYGLAFDYYTHFTSPIRRYPDVLVHRLLDIYLQGMDSADKELLEIQCRHSTAMEMKAAEAERASIKYKQVEYLQHFLGHEFNGIVSGVTEWGIYIELSDNKCEGMIRMRELDDDFYEFDESNFRIVGARTGRIFTLGDEVRVSVVRCDLVKKQIDFRLAGENNTMPLKQEKNRKAKPDHNNYKKSRRRR